MNIFLVSLLTATCATHIVSHSNYLERNKNYEIPLHRKRHFHRYPNNTSIIVCLFRGKIFTQTLPNNERLL